jgi:AraC-like DNA-binding protein
VADIAARCGFTSATYFFHAFRQHFGHGPATSAVGVVSESHLHQPRRTILCGNAADAVRSCPDNS